MSNIGWAEILVVVVLLLVIFGPKKLPELGASLGKSIRGFRKGLRDNKEEIKSTVAQVREASGIDEVKSTVAEVREAAGLDEMKSTVAEIRDAVGVGEVKSTLAEIRQAADIRGALTAKPATAGGAGAGAAPPTTVGTVQMVPVGEAPAGAPADEAPLGVTATEAGVAPTVPAPLYSTVTAVDTMTPLYSTATAADPMAAAALSETPGQTPVEPAGSSANDTGPAT